MMNSLMKKCLLIPVFLGMGLPLASVSALAADADPASRWYRQGLDALEQNRSTALAAAANLQSKAKNIILFIGDGMGISTVTAARILDGQRRGGAGEEGLLHFETFPHLALSKTYSTDQQTAESAGSMSAMMTGIKTRAGVISVNQDAPRGDCGSLAGNELITALELAEIAGMSTGVVTNTRLTHATAAATYAHTVERGHEDDSLGTGLRHADRCTDIARQLVEFPKRFVDRYPQVDGLEVALGGGRRGFLAGSGDVDPETGKPGKRRDGRNLVREWLQQYRDSAYVWNSDQLMALDVKKTRHLLGLFQPSHMRFEADRENDKGGEPSVVTMTEKSIEILSGNPNGFFLMVEGGRIDHAHHMMDPANALNETIVFAEAIRRAQELTDPAETLILVTADHSHVMSIRGYPVRGNPILGKVISHTGKGTVTEAANTLGYSTKEHRGKPWETHAGEDVAIYATGPGAALVRGTLEQNVIYHIMNDAAELEQRARQRGWSGRR